MSFSMDTMPKSCSGWNTARKANLSTVVQREWVFGYISGLRDALLTHSNKEIYGLLPANENIVLFVNAYCESQPQSTVNDAVRHLIDGLFKPR
ncbi:MAG: hypothetical protein ACKO5X_09565 [Limnohabitans sp.]